MLIKNISVEPSESSDENEDFFIKLKLSRKEFGSVETAFEFTLGESCVRLRLEISREKSQRVRNLQIEGVRSIQRTENEDFQRDHHEEEANEVEKIPITNTNKKKRKRKRVEREEPPPPPPEETQQDMSDPWEEEIQSYEVTAPAYEIYPHPHTSEDQKPSRESLEIFPITPQSAPVAQTSEKLPSNVSHKLEPKRMKCHKCDFTTLHSQALTIHCRSHDITSFRCPLCSYTTDRAFNIKRHLATHSKSSSGGYGAPMTVDHSGFKIVEDGVVSKVKN